MFNFNNINKNLSNNDINILYHFGIDTSMNLKEIFNNITHVIFTRSKGGARELTHSLFQTVYNIDQNILCLPLFKTERFHLYKVNSIIVVSYGYGAPSMLICLNEIFKLLFYINMLNAKIIMLGDCNSIDLPLGTVIVNNKFLNNRFEEKMDFIECGNNYTYSTILNSQLMVELIDFSNSYKDSKVEIGALLSTFDFFEEQGRLDGFLCPDYSQDQINDFFKLVKNQNIKCFDTVSLEFAAFCNHINLNACVINYVVNNHKHDVHHDQEDYNNLISKNAMFKFVTKYIESTLGSKK